MMYRKTISKPKPLSEHPFLKVRRNQRQTNRALKKAQKDDKQIRTLCLTALNDLDTQESFLAQASQFLKDLESPSPLEAAAATDSSSGH